MKDFCSRICLVACLVLSIQGGRCLAQDNPEIIQPEKMTLSRSLRAARTISKEYVCIEPCNLLATYAPVKTIFMDVAPGEIGSFDDLAATQAFYLTQDIKTSPLGNAALSEVAIGKDARTYPGWLVRGLVITLVCSIAGYLLSLFLRREKQAYLSAWQLVAIIVPLVPFLLLLLAFGFMSVVMSSVPDPKVDIYVDNATTSPYEILFNGVKVDLPAETHICLNVRPRQHDLRIRKKGSSQATRYAVFAAFDEGETYVINLERANRYNVEHMTYTIN